MRPTSVVERRLGCKAGFTLFEMLIVLVIMSLAVALALPMISGAVDKAGAQTAMLDFQRQVMGLRADAFHSQTPILLRDAPVPTHDPVAEPRPVRLTLPGGWDYSLSSAITVDTAGGCSASQVFLLKGGLRRASLRNAAGDCHFARD